MIKKLIVSRLHNIAAIFYNDQLQEFIAINNTYQVGDIYLGVINKIFQSINAAFVNLQVKEKNGFIHANDSGPLKRKPNINNITKICSVNQKILVQIVKESTLHKGPKLTANITISGKYIILMPFNHVTCIARSISDEKQRYHLKALAILFKPLNMGILFRQSSIGINESILFEELNNLKKQWNFIEKSVITGINPYLIYKNDNIIQKILRDFYDSSIQDIIVDSNKTLLQLNKYFQNNVYSEKPSNINLELLENTEHFLATLHLTSKVLNNLNNHILLPFGGYLSIEISDALTMVDVNSGSFRNATTSRETILITNCLAATEIGYQLCKKDITGIIVIDFINIYNQQDKLYFLEHFCRILKQDYTKPQIVQLSELGLIEIVRQRRGRNVLDLFGKHLLLYENSYYTGDKKSFYNHSIFFRKFFHIFVQW